MTDDGARDAGIEPRPPTAGDASRAPLRSLLRSGAGALSATRKIAGTAVHEGLESLAHPQHAAHLAGVVAQDAGPLAKLLAAPADADTVLRQPLHGAPRGVVGPVPARADQGRRPALRGNCQCGW